MDKEIREYSDRIKSMDDEELIEYYKKQPMKKYDRLNFAYVKIRILLDYIKVIEGNSSQLTEPALIVSRESKKIKVSANLWHYLILEICSFYEVVKKIKKEEKLDLPVVPDYYSTVLCPFRGQVIAHLNPNGNLNTISQWMGEFLKVQKIGEGKLLQDFNDYYEICLEKLKGEI